MSNHLKSRELRAITVMAGMLLSSGCLFPQDDQVLDQIPPRRNMPLRIIAPKPAGPRTTYFTQPQCAPADQGFSLTVADEDTVDVIYSLWFIDQDPNTVPFSATPRPAGTSVARKLDQPQATTFTNALSNLMTGTHLLTVFVADTTFNEVNGGVITVAQRFVPVPEGDGGTTVVADTGYVDSFTWVLQVERCP
jgi:hypothetical protein